MITIDPSSSVIIYVMTATNKRLLIYESYGDSNRCTPCRGKPDQDAAYAQRTLHAGSPRTWQPFTSRRQIWTDPTALEKKGSRHNPQHADWPIRGSVPSFSPDPTNEAGGVSQAPVGDPLLGLPDPYHRHAISTFNSCLRGPTHWFLIDTGGGYNLGGAGLPHTTPRPFQPAVSTFHLREPPDLQFNQVPTTKLKCWV
jgi:hypothetical protein